MGVGYFFYLKLVNKKEEGAPVGFDFLELAETFPSIIGDIISSQDSSSTS